MTGKAKVKINPDAPRRKRKQRTKVFYAAILIGCILSLLILYAANRFAWEKSKIYVAMGIVWALVIGGEVTVNMFHTKKANSHMIYLLSILMEDGDVDRYIEETQQAIDKESFRIYKAMYQIDLALGYSCKGDHKKACEILKSVDDSVLRGPNEALLYLNLAYEYFYEENYKKLIETMEYRWKFLKKYDIDPQLGPLVSLCLAMYFYAKDKPNDGYECLEELKQKSKDPTIADQIRLFTAMDKMHRGDYQEAKAFIDEVLQGNPSQEMKMRAEVLQTKLSQKEV